MVFKELKIAGILDFILRKAEHLQYFVKLILTYIFLKKSVPSLCKNKVIVETTTHSILKKLYFQKKIPSQKEAQNFENYFNIFRVRHRWVHGKTDTNAKKSIFSNPKDCRTKET